MAQALDPGVASDAPNPSQLPWSSLSRTFGAALNANGHVEQDLWALVPMARLPNITNGTTRHAAWRRLDSGFVSAIKFYRARMGLSVRSDVAAGRGRGIFSF